ncbi:MAG TPA: ferredoxin [Erysipelotrichaceae bacterium]|nr:ferredoxin [Erysipelotrichaceae bacterium]
MKSLSDLQKIRDEAKKRVSMREGNQNYRVVVGMATCGIAAGARPVLNAFVEEVAKNNYSASVTQTGCIGMCTLEPIVEIFDLEGKKTTYVLVDPRKAIEICEEHLGKGKVKNEYSVASLEAKR